MQRVPWDRRSRRAGTARRSVIVAVAALALLAVAAAGMAATLAPGPNGCPTNKSLKTAPIADLAPPARTQIEAFDVLSGPINEGTQTFTLKVRVGSTCGGVNIKGASVYVTAVPYNQFTIPDEELTGDEGTATLVYRRDANFPASQQAAAADAVHPGDEAGRGPPQAGVSARQLSARFPSGARPRPYHTAAPGACSRRGRRWPEPVTRLRCRAFAALRQQGSVQLFDESPIFTASIDRRQE